MEAYRLSKKIYASTLSGKGAAIKGARWNSIGVEIIYTAINRSLAMAEIAVHFSLAALPSDYMMVTIYVPDDISLLKLIPTDLPTDWNAFPHPSATQAIGDQFIGDNKYCVLQIPSAVTQGDYNLLINPNHPDFIRIKIISIENFPFDKRIFK
ncbi:RES family NAD+ phosphorylase [Parasediminibacterium sp. JCM 36343]|uniref:RES family NAD+ phosphorylase n=1 Tax=Parasediminibacterium sp. JCM 36343 TaxID=3374279 RepID=UPI00397D64FC